MGFKVSRDSVPNFCSSCGERLKEDDPNNGPPAGKHVSHNTYVRMVFVEFSSASNTISPMTLIQHHTLLLDIRPPRKQTLEILIAGHSSYTPVAPQRFVLSPLLFTLDTHDCYLRNRDLTAEYANNTTFFGWISNNNYSSYQEESTILQRAALTTIYCSTSAKPRDDC